MNLSEDIPFIELGGGFFPCTISARSPKMGWDIARYVSNHTGWGPQSKSRLVALEILEKWFNII